MNDILQTRTLTYNLWSHTDFAKSFIKTSRFSLNSLCYFASKVWNIKDASNLQIFKNKIRKWKPKECHCDLFRPYVSNLGFVNLVKIEFN